MRSRCADSSRCCSESLVEGVIGVIAGIVIVVWPAITALVLFYIAAAWAIITVIVRIP